MPRNELNNPRTRILLLLDEMHEWQTYARTLATALATSAPGEFEQMPVEPSDKQYALEQQRNQFLGRKLDANRASMRRQRYLRSHGLEPHATPADFIQPRLAPSVVDKIAAELAREPEVKISTDLIPISSSPSVDNQPLHTSIDINPDAEE